ncbi:hypothetical protein WJX72_008310 [[Myrmecia] bisecta]|uniref:Cytochrome c oxidase assembly factor 6 n=1 Tax=[Myrmecia] bisecta TaxID=41462 RepID=A0AAW1QFR6_9CHLO
MPATTDVEGSVLKGARKECYQAKDEFYQCMVEQGIDFTTSTPVPAACKQRRQQFEAACRASWVHHFDRLRDKEVLLVQTLHSNINRTTDKTGRLAGEPQPAEKQHS